MSEQSAGGGRGYCGRILHVDLSAGTYEYEEPGDDFYRKYLSGVGLGARVLWDRIPAGADPLGPDNILGFTTGLLTDTGAVFTGRFTVVGKSPQTGGWGDANCGGAFSPFLKRCGVDAVFFRGISDKPVYVYLDRETVEIRDAEHLWGLDALEAEEKLKEEHGKTSQPACIGPAGEKLSFMAGISNDRGRYAARSGLGAVMGSKKLKAVVAAGKGRPETANPEMIKGLTKDFRKKMEGKKFMQSILGDGFFSFMGRLLRISPVATRQPFDLMRAMLIKYGTPAFTALLAEAGDSPIKNWGGVGYKDFPLEKSQKIGAGSIIRHETGKYGCYSCPIRCGGEIEYPHGRWPVKNMHKPEYETICAFGSLNLNDDLDAVMKLNDMCNRGGVDTISAGAVTAFAIECFENGVLTEEDTGGLKLAWGDSEAIVKLVELIIRREGIGDVLADGVKPAAEKIGRGAEKYAVHCGGVEPPMHDPKFDPGFGVTYYLEPTPGRHTIGSYTYLEFQMLEKQFSRAAKLPGVVTPGSRRDAKKTSDAIAVNVFYKMLIDASGACLFGTQVGGPLPICAWMNAAAGWEMTNDEYLVIGERIHQLRHAFNTREGLNAARDFKPHGRVYGDPPFDHGPTKNVTLDMDRIADEYYAAMHWRREDGRNEKAHLEELGLDDVAAALYSGEA
jgi:aldehyde:ferredoxin oxidoreductase